MHVSWTIWTSAYSLVIIPYALQPCKSDDQHRQKTNKSQPSTPNKTKQNPRNLACATHRHSGQRVKWYTRKSKPSTRVPETKTDTVHISSRSYGRRRNQCSRRIRDGVWYSKSNENTAARDDEDSLCNPYLPPMHAAANRTKPWFVRTQPSRQSGSTCPPTVWICNEINLITMNPSVAITDTVLLPCSDLSITILILDKAGYTMYHMQCNGHIACSCSSLSIIS